MICAVLLAAVDADINVITWLMHVGWFAVRSPW